MVDRVASLFFGVFGLLAACASTGPPVTTGVVREGGDLRVQFRRQGYGVAHHAARVEADGGALEQVVHSADLRTVSTLWRHPYGTLSVRFAFGGAASVTAETPDAGDVIEYVFYERDGVRVSTRLPRSCVVRPFLDLAVHAEASSLPASLALPGGSPRALAAGTSIVRLALRQRDVVLKSGDLELFVIHGSRRRSFLVGVDPDGTPSAVTGYVQTLDTEVE